MSHIQEAADYIAAFAPDLAKAFVAQPFRRVQFAQIFSDNFSHKSDHARLICRLVVNLAQLDQYDRQAKGLEEARAQADANLSAAIRALLEEQ